MVFSSVVPNAILEDVKKDAIMNKKLSPFYGRVDQKNYILTVVFLALWLFIFWSFLNYFLSPFPQVVFFAFIANLVFVFLLWWIVTVRRLHDMGKSGFLSIILFLPGINILFSVALMTARSEALINPHGIPVPPGLGYLDVLFRRFNQYDRE